MDFSRMSPQEIEALYRRRGSLDPAIRAAVEQAHAAILAGASRSWNGSGPEELDPVAAADTPIAQDPELPTAPKAPTAPVVSPLEAREAQLTAAGLTGDEAARTASQERDVHGDALFGQGVSAYDNPVDNAARAKRIQGLRQREAGQAAFEANYMPPEAPADMSDIDAVLGRQMGADGQYRRVRPFGPVAPGPAQRVARDEAMLNAAAEKRKEQNAAALAARQQWEQQNPDDAAARKVKGQQNLEDYKKERAMFRAARRQGVSVQEVQAQANGAWDSVGGRQPLAALPGQEQQNFTPAGVRFADENRRIADDNARKAAWRAQTMLAGSNPRKNIVNALGQLTPEQRQQSIRFMLPGGQLAAQVDAHQLQAAAALAQRAVTGALAGTAQGPMAQAQAAILGLQAQAERDKLRSGDEDVLGNKYAPSGWTGYDEFTEDEQGQMYDDLVAQGYSEPEAKRAVDRQAQKRRATKRKQWSNKGS